MLVPFFLVYFRMQRVGREHLPRSGPLLLASNHRSFLDPFVIGTLVRRPVYYMAKRELFEKRWQAWMLNALGAFPVDRGAGDGDAMADRAGDPRNGATAWWCSRRARACARGRWASRGAAIGRLALETGAPVAPVAVIGSDAVRRGWRIRPRKVRLRVGRSAALPDRRALLAGACGRSHRADLGVREPAVGLAGRRRRRQPGELGEAPRARGIPRGLNAAAGLRRGSVR